MLDLATLHEAIAAEVPDRECLIWRDRRLTWRDVADRTSRLANLLIAHGLGVRGGAAEPWESPHDHLALYLHNGPEYLEGLVGAHKARVAPFNVNYRYVADELAYLFKDAGPRAVIYHGRFAATLAEVLGGMETAPLLLQVADGSGAPLLPGALDYEAALAASTAARPAAEPAGTDLQILYTGGTTGMPKGVLWRIGDLMTGPLGLPQGVTAAEVVAAATAREPRKVLVAPPFMHGAGTWSALGAWMGGGAVVLPEVVDALDAADLLATAERERVHRIPMVGDAFARPITEELERGSYDLSGLRQIVNSGAAINPALRRRLAACLPHVRIIDLVGSSETGFQITRLGDTPFDAVSGAFVVSADRTRILEPGSAEDGWLAKAGSIPLAYLGDPARSAGTFVTLAGVRMVVSGDRARVLADGRVEMYGRESTTINTGGEKVFAEEVEAVVRGVDGVADALVLGRPSERWGQEVVAVIRLGADLGDEELRAACALHLARYKIPKAFVRTAEPLRLPNGKADYATARRLAAGGGAE